MLQLLSIILFAFMSHSTDIDAKEPKLKPIFNGKNLKGWVVPENNIWWSVADGVLSVKSGPNKKASILWTKKPYKNFVIELEFKFGKGTVDSGIFIRADHEQLQIGISGSLKRDMTASPYIAGKGYPVEAKGVKELLNLDSWNTIKLRAVGSKYTSWLNGTEVMNYTSETAALQGPIGLQLHGNREMEINFRNIRLAKLK